MVPDHDDPTVAPRARPGYPRAWRRMSGEEEEQSVPFDPFAQLPIGSTEVSVISLAHTPVPA